MIREVVLDEHAKLAIRKILKMQESGKSFFKCSKLETEHEVQIAIEIVVNDFMYSGDDPKKFQQSFDDMIGEILVQLMYCED